MELNDLVHALLKGDPRRIDTTWEGFKVSGYTIKYKNQTIIRIDVHNPKQKTLT